MERYTSLDMDFERRPHSERNSQDVEGEGSAFKDAIQSAAAVAIGPPRCRRTEWISNATLEIVEKRRYARLVRNMDEYCGLNAVRNRMIKDDKQRWFVGLARERIRQMRTFGCFVTPAAAQGGRWLAPSSDGKIYIAGHGSRTTATLGKK